MDTRTLARLHALARVLVGVAFTAAPRRTGRIWIGEESDAPGAQVALSAFGVRDAAIGVGAAWALGGGEPARRWILAGLASDVVDLTATFRRRNELPAWAAYSSLGVAVTSIALGAWLQGEVD